MTCPMYFWTAEYLKSSLHADGVVTTQPVSNRAVPPSGLAAVPPCGMGLLADYGMAVPDGIYLDLSNNSEVDPEPGKPGKRYQLIPSLPQTYSKDFIST